MFFSRIEFKDIGKIKGLGKIKGDFFMLRGMFELLWGW